MVTLSDTLFSGAPDRFEWRAPGKPVSVSIAFDVMEGILSRAGRWRPWRKPRETGGVLFGAVEEGGFQRVRIDDAVEVPCSYVFGPTYSLGGADKKAIRTAVEANRDSGRRVVGFYRTHTREGLALDADDLLLFSEFFPGAENVALLVKPRLFRNAIGGFFFWEGTGIRAESSYLEFGIDARKRRVLLREPDPDSALTAAGPEPLPAAPVARSMTPPERPARPSVGAVPAVLRSQRGKGRVWCSAWVQAPLLAILLAAQGYLGFISGRELTRISKPRETPHDPYALSLTVLEYGDNLQLTWDRLAVPVASSEGARVSITDGQNVREIDLSPAQLRNGSVIYRRVSPEVRFRLEVFMKGNRSVSETWVASRDSGAEPRPSDDKPPAPDPTLRQQKIGTTSPG